MNKKRYTFPPLVQQTFNVLLDEDLLQASTLKTVRSIGIRSYEVDAYEENDWVDSSDPTIHWD